jgi:hypothetical protein
MKNAVGVPSSLKPKRNGAAMSAATSAKSNVRWPLTGSDLMTLVGKHFVIAAPNSTTMPATIDTAVAAPSSLKPRMNGPAIRSAA